MMALSSCIDGGLASQMNTLMVTKVGSNHGLGVCKSHLAPNINFLFCGFFLAQIPMTSHSLAVFDAFLSTPCHEDARLL